MIEGKYPKPTLQEVSLIGLCQEYVNIYKIDLPTFRLIAEKLDIVFFKRCSQLYLISDYINKDDAERLAAAVKKHCELINTPLAVNEVILGSSGPRYIQASPN